MPAAASPLCAALLALAPAACLVAADQAAARRPNVVVVYVDDQSRDMLGCYGGRAPTPRIDALARDGVRCERYYANTAVCCASRYALLSGRYASRSAALLACCPPGRPVSLGWESSVVGEDHTLPLTLQRAGYTTGMVGKWHQGWPRWQEAMPPVAGDAPIDDPAVAALLRRNYDHARSQVLGSGFAWVDGLYWSNIDDGGRRTWMPKQHQHHNPEWVTAAALRFLDQQAGAQAPFLLYVATTLPHWPRPLVSLEQGDPLVAATGRLDAPPASGMAGRAEIRTRLAAAGLPRSKDERLQRWEGWQEAAAASVWVDEAVGAILDRLERHGMARDTLVVYSSDNGFPPGKFTAYEEGSRLPLILRWPGGLPAGAVSPALASTVDLAPTIYAACSIRPPAEAHLDGADLLPALRGQAPGQAAVYLENACTRAVVDAEGWKYLAVRLPPAAQAEQLAGKRVSQWGRVLDGKDQLTFSAEKRWPHYFAADQLYQVERDPEERSNLAGDPACAARLAAIKARLTAYSASLPHSFGEFRPAIAP
jgi:arylsulfatase A-like enzyme